MEFKLRELEGKLEMEQAARNRQDNVIRRLRDNVKRLGEEKEELQRGDGSTGESLRRSVAVNTLCMVYIIVWYTGLTDRSGN
jgi:hypothetical protein